MKSRIPISIAFIALFAFLLLAGCGRKDPAASGNGAPPPIAVRVETIRTRPLIDALQVAGIVKASEDVFLSPEEGGIVKEWKAAKGERVRRGELLVVLKDEVIRASYDAAEAQYQMSKLNAEKQEAVYEEKGISELQYRGLQYGRDAAKANADLMKARVERAQLRSPVDGVLDDTFFDPGEFAPPGQPIAHIVNLAKLKVQAEIPERNAGTLAPGTAALLTFDALPNDTLRGFVSYIGSTVSASNRTLMVEIVLSNPGTRLKPEMIAKVRLLRKSRTDAILVSENIIQLVDRDRHIVYVEQNGKAEERKLTLGGRDGNSIEVLEGLLPGDRLITVGYQRLANGQPVLVEN